MPRVKPNSNIWAVGTPWVGVATETKNKTSEQKSKAMIPWAAQPVSARAPCSTRPGRDAGAVPAVCPLWCGCPPVSRSVGTMTPTTHSSLLSVFHCQLVAPSAGPAGLPTPAVLPAAPHLCYNTTLIQPHVLMCYPTLLYCGGGAAYK